MGVEKQAPSAQPPTAVRRTEPAAPAGAEFAFPVAASGIPMPVAYAGLRSSDILSLQRLVGNQAVLRMVAGQRHPGSASSTPGTMGWLQEATRDDRPNSFVQREVSPGNATTSATTESPGARMDYVFVMGSDQGRGFYTKATAYFTKKHPEATLVKSKRTLEDVLKYIRKLGSGVKIGNLYVVTHANEEGTLFFALDQKDRKRPGKPVTGQTGDSQISPPELKGALARLPKPGSKMDEQTKVYIKGCNIGQNQGMVGQLREAFGGKAEVIAPTTLIEYRVPVTADGAPDLSKPAKEFLEFPADMRLPTTGDLDQLDL